MSQASNLQVTLPQETLEFIQSKVASGEFSSESEVILEGIAVLREKHVGFERWARDVAVPAYERLVADPSRGVPLDKVRANLAARLNGTRA